MLYWPYHLAWLLVVASSPALGAGTTNCSLSTGSSLGANNVITVTYMASWRHRIFLELVAMPVHTRGPHQVRSGFWGV